MGNAIAGFFNHIGGIVRENTLVQYYDYVKALEYLICVGYLVVFPIFYKHIIKYNRDAGNQDE